MSSPLSPTDLARALREARTIAIVGCSPRAFQTSHRIAQYLQRVGYRVVPVNPHQSEILGETCYPDLLSIPEEIDIDIVNVFRRPEHTPGVAQDAADRAERTDTAPLVWTQLGVHHPEAERIAEAAGLPYVANRCLMVDHAAFAA